jgi:hypothetical protein
LVWSRHRSSFGVYELVEVRMGLVFGQLPSLIATAFTPFITAMFFVLVVLIMSG